LFGKDTKDRKDYNIRSIVNGEPLHRVECSVAAVLDINGEPVTLRRAFVEKWVKPRGQIEEVFKGNETETFWNDVPVNVSEYQKRINGIIDETVFKMVTNPFFFVSMKWQEQREQREQLFQLAGTIPDREIAAQKPEYAALLNKIAGKSWADFKREIAARKKRLKDELSGVQPRIDQTQKLMPADNPFEFERLEGEIKRQETQLIELDKALSDQAAASSLHNDKILAKQREINALKERKQAILAEARAATQEEARQANSARSEIEAQIRDKQDKAASLQRIVQRTQAELADLQDKVTTRATQRDSLRSQWYEENAKEYAGDDTCSLCGQPLPENLREQARKRFDEGKATLLEEIKTRGTRLAEEVKRLEAEATEARIEVTAQSAGIHSRGGEHQATGGGRAGVAGREDVRR
jgi:hypothetical protein